MYASHRVDLSLEERRERGVTVDVVGIVLESRGSEGGFLQSRRRCAEHVN